ncbi:MAG: hypothetical protein M0036_10270 [Desulfobacteraceae bacterium]|nr:hypothetical protein [Desulfobacteraceae bacterium]
MSDVKLQILLTAQEQTKAAFDAVNRRMETTTARLSNMFKGLAGGLLAGASVSAAVAGLNTVADAASNMQETVSKTNTLFGSAQGQALEQWAGGAAKAMGLAGQEALDAVGDIGDMFLKLGAGAGQAADVSKRMVALSADITSFKNVSGGAVEVLGAMQSAFRGEYDSLQKYIPTISAAAVEQAALAATGKKSAKELTDLEKAMAVYRLTIEGAGAATGDFGRTSDQLANGQRILDAHLKNIVASMGTGVVPGYNDAVQALNQWVEKNDEFSKQIGTITTGFRAIGDAVAFIARHSDKATVLFNILTRNTIGSLKSAIELYRAMSDDTGTDERSGPRTIKIGADTPVIDPSANKAAADAADRAAREAAAARERLAALKAANEAALKDQEKFWEEWHAMEVKQATAYDDAFIQGFQDTEAALKEMREAAAEPIDIAFTMDGLDWYLEETDRRTQESLANFEKYSLDLSTLSQHTAESMADNLSDLFFDVITGKLATLEEYATAVLQSIARAMSDMMAQAVVRQAASGLGSLFSGGGESMAEFPVNAGDFVVAHTGGTVGNLHGPRRRMSVAAFADAPRLHSGLFAPDEYPAILQRGEIVIPAGGRPAGASAAAPQVEIHIHTDGEEKRVVRQEASFDGVKMVCEAWLEGYNSGRFGMRQALGR